MLTKLRTVVVFICGFYLLWILRVYLISPVLDSIDNTSLTYAVLNIGLKIVLWLLPVYLYLKYVDKVNPWQYLKLTTNIRRGIFGGLVISLAYFAYYLFTSSHGPQFNLVGVDTNSFVGAGLLAGLIEEIVFRGFILQKLAQVMNFHLANLTAGVLFLLIHFPYWIYSGAINTTSVLVMGSIVILGLITGYLLRYTKSLWGSITLHTINNLCSLVLFRA